MLLGGYQKLTLIDYPGHIATTVFTVGCNFRCPFCHNPELIKSNVFSGSKMEEEFFEFLKKRKGKLQGVCITGGEPTLQKDLLDFMRKVKKLGFKVKLDSNGTRPDVIKKAIDEKLVDFIAMDIKNQLSRYKETSGDWIDLERIRLSVEIIRNSKLPYEFRTTVVPGIHTMRDFVEIAKWISGAPIYSLQEYREEKILDPNLKKKTKNRKIDLEKIKAKIESHFGKVLIKR